MTASDCLFLQRKIVGAHRGAADEPGGDRWEGGGLTGGWGDDVDERDRAWETPASHGGFGERGPDCCRLLLIAADCCRLLPIASDRC